MSCASVADVVRRIAGEEGWEVLHLDRLGRRLKMLAALGAGTALASLGRVVREHSDGARADVPRAARGSSRMLPSRAPGRRPEYSDAYYAAFIRDPEGNRIEAATFIEAPK